MAHAPAPQRGRIAAAAAVAGGALSALSALSALVACYDFDFTPPAPVADAAAEAAPPSDAGRCTAGRAYCGGNGVRGAIDTLYRCAADGGAALVAKCASGCLRDGGTSESRCAMPAAPCRVGGFYCGGDKLDGDPGILYRCGTGGTPVVAERCAKGCQVEKSGSDDACVK
jgi:hypothetical protein